MEHPFSRDRLIKTTLHKDSLAVDILKIVGQGVLLVALLALPNLGVALRPFFRQYRNPPRPCRVRRTVRRLQQDGYIQTHRKNGHHSYALTRHGREYLTLCSLRIDIQEHSPWDGTWRVVMFDIPETEGWKRRTFQATLRRAGFFPLQRSIFVSPHPCEKEIRKALQTIGLMNEVLLLETTFLGVADKDVRRFFRL